jgi:hypothetical protein
VVQEVDLDDVHPHALTAAVNACRARWALVKALVVGEDPPAAVCGFKMANELRAQRDAVFAALADMARAEEAAFRAQDSVAAHLCGCVYRGAIHTSRREDRPSADLLAAYVEHIVEQVGVL